MFEVGVLGVGTMGSMAVWQLARRGVRVIGFEQFLIGHDRGAAAGETRIFRTAYREGADYVPLLSAAEGLWRQLEQDTGFDLLDLRGVASVGRPDHPAIAATIETVDRFGLDAEVLDAAEANARFPVLNVLADEVAVLDRHGGLVKPEIAVTVAVRSAEERGATIVRNTPVVAIEPDSSGVWIRTESDQYRVGTLIVTAGAWAGQFLNQVRPRLITPHRLVLHWFPTRRPGLFTPDKFPTVLRMSLGADIGMFPSQDGVTVKAGLNVDIGPIPSAERLERSVGYQESARIRAVLAALYPDISPEPVRAAAYTDGFTADEHAVVGPLAEMPNVLVAAGFSAHGFKLAPAIGAALADMATNGGTDLPIGHLSPDRAIHPLGRDYSSAGGPEIHPGVC